MKKFNKNDLLNISLLILTLVVGVLLITRGKFEFGSSKDWSQQHFLIPEYMRNLFYETHNLFMDYAFNIGGGENIYYLSYYGLFSPIILVSYLLPFISMKNYIIGSSIFMLGLSSILMYFFIKKKSDSKIGLLISFIFLFSTPLLFHAHRHIMFMNYYPFLLMGYFGVDRYFEKNKRGLLAISVFLMILTNYFFSVSGIVSIVLYGIYVYLQKNEKISFRKFFIDGIKFLIPIMIGVLMSCVLIIPTFYCLLSGRDMAVTKMHTNNLFVPEFNLKSILYSSYSMGLSLISIFALIENIISKKKENIFISVILLLFAFVPIFRYVLNGTLYIENKVLIVFIPLFMLLIRNTILRFIDNKFDYKKVLMIMTVFVSCCLVIYRRGDLFVSIFDFIVLFISLKLFNKKKNIKYLYIIVIFMFITTICFSCGDTLVLKGKKDKYEKDVYDILEKDKDVYRVNVISDSDVINKIYNTNYYTGMIYSSTNNRHYKDFYYNQIGNNIIFRNNIMMYNTRNVFYNMKMGNRYYIGKNIHSNFYKKIDSNIYKNDYVLPIGYSSNKVMSLTQFNFLPYPEKYYALLNYVIVDEYYDIEYKNHFEDIPIDKIKVSNNDFLYSYENNNYKATLLNEGHLRFSFEDDLKDKTLVVRFDMNYAETCKVGDTVITINGMKNKLTCREWKYNNGNNVFEYVIDGAEELDVKLSVGTYDISNISISKIDNNDLREISKSISEFKIDRDKTKGNRIIGIIDSSDDGILNTSIPYDKGYTIYVDSKKVDYYMTDVDFIGFDISKGKHKIEIIYEAPFKNISMILSLFGFVLLGGLYVFDYKFSRKFN